MRKFLTTILTLMVCPLMAQNLAITGFRIDETDQTANTAGTTVIDQNGEKCALLRVETTETGFSFDVGQMGIVKNEKKTGEYWLYVPGGVKRISVFHNTLGIIRDYDLGTTLRAAKTYILTLKSSSTPVTEQSTMQYLVFSLYPSNAVVLLEGPDQETTFIQGEEGTASKYLKFGTYKYTVQASEYHSQSGTVEVNNPDQKHQISVNLRPAYGYLEVPSIENLGGATVTIDNKIAGTVPLSSVQLSSGRHTILISKQKYKTYRTEVTIEDGAVFTLNTQLQSNFSNVTISSLEGCDILIDGEMVGQSPWTGELEYGPHNIECRMTGYRSITKSIDYSSSIGASLTIPSPTPMYGTLVTECNPPVANIYVDGKLIGETPLATNKILVGTHRIRIAKQGYSDFIKEVTIAEGKTETISARLSMGVNVTLSTKASNATIILDDYQVSNLSSITELAIGQHTISISSPDCKPLTKTFTVSQDSDNSFSFDPESALGGQTITVNGVSFKMIAVEGGEYTMGGTAEQGYEAQDDEKPIHDVTVQSFYIGETEVTQQLWVAIMGENPSYFKKSPKNPVEWVTWDQCQDFIDKLNSITGKQFRLPTEAEWEYAARGGKKSKGFKYSGSNRIDSVAWYSLNSDNMTHPVKTKAPNELGIYDMTGNVWEWCSDYYNEYLASSATASTKHVLRGGSYYYIASFCRNTTRRSYYPYNRYLYLGLRLVL